MGFDFGAEAADVGVDGAGVDGLVVAPDLAQEGLAAEGAALVLHEVGKEVVFSGGEVDVVAVEDDAALGGPQL